jgi:hypothetical protein
MTYVVLGGAVPAVPALASERHQVAAAHRSAGAEHDRVALVASHVIGVNRNLHYDEMRRSGARALSGGFPMRRRHDLVSRESTGDTHVIAMEPPLESPALPLLGLRRSGNLWPDVYVTDGAGVVRRRSVHLADSGGECVLLLLRQRNSAVGRRRYGKRGMEGASRSRASHAAKARQQAATNADSE